MDIFTSWVPTDDHATYEQLGISWSDPDDSLTETIHGLLAAGRVTPKQAGALAG
jgi:hypothetical protein